MFLIFNLSRPDVLPLDDLGLIRAISINYFSGEPVTRSEAREVAANWEPWRTVATWYIPGTCGVVWIRCRSTIDPSRCDVMLSQGYRFCRVDSFEVVLTAAVAVRIRAAW
jgi:hypothetical protein